MALLLLAHAARAGSISAVTIDHQLRAESAGEAAEVARICAELEVPHQVLKVTVAAGNVQAEARRARYAAMAAWLTEQGLGALATAHHADDQTETVMMRLNRASGVAGLAGVRAKGHLPDSAHVLLRPLLAWPRADLWAVVAASGLIPADDASNHDPRYDRVRMRLNLAQADWLDQAAIAQSAAHLADADDALEWAAAREWAEHVESGSLGISYRPHAPRAIYLRVVNRIVTTLAGQEPRGAAVAQLCDALLRGEAASIGTLVARANRSGWSFRQAPKRRN